MPPANSETHRRRAVVGDAGELVRFLITGVSATLGNMATVWIMRDFLPVVATFALGLVAGLICSFVLMKLFTFRANDWSNGPGEAVRFVCVYCVGAAAYVFVALECERLLTGAGLMPRLAAVGGVFGGGFVMAMISYVGHRHFTYRATP